EGQPRRVPADRGELSAEAGALVLSREAHRHSEPLARGPLGEADARAVAFRAGLDDRQPEPAAGRRRSGATAGAIEHPLALGGWTAGPVVPHRQARPAAVTRLLAPGARAPACARPGGWRAARPPTGFPSPRRARRLRWPARAWPSAGAAR